VDLHIGVCVYVCVCVFVYVRIKFAYKLHHALRFSSVCEEKRIILWVHA